MSSHTSRNNTDRKSSSLLRNLLSVQAMDKIVNRPIKTKVDPQRQSKRRSSEIKRAESLTSLASASFRPDESERNGSVVLSARTSSDRNFSENDTKLRAGDQGVVDTTTSDDAAEPKVVFPLWTQFTKLLRKYVVYGVVSLSVAAAKRPKLTIAIVPTISLILLAAGYYTNFEFISNQYDSFAPFNSLSAKHRAWMLDENANEPRFDKQSPLMMVIHDVENKTVLTKNGIQKVFQAIDAVRELPGYEEICSQGKYVEPWNGAIGEITGPTTCQIQSITRFWQHDESNFFDSIETDADVRMAVSNIRTPDGTPIDLTALLGEMEYEYNYDTPTGIPLRNITSVKAFFVYIRLVRTDGTLDLEQTALDRLFELQKEWQDEVVFVESMDDNNMPKYDLDYNTIQVEVMADRSMADELMVAVFKDLPLMPICFGIMSIFTCLNFLFADGGITKNYGKWAFNPVQSRCLLGIGSVLTIVFSIMTGCGIMFIFGVPYTNMTSILPFILFGIGLDDTFIITGNFFTVSYTNDPVDKLQDTMTHIGMSIFVTTLTTSLAFILGTISNIPAIYWLCIYASVMIIVDFIYQITFFVAILILDERRIQEHRKEKIWFCCNKPSNQDNRVIMEQQVHQEDLPVTITELKPISEDKICEEEEKREYEEDDDATIVMSSLSKGGNIKYMCDADDGYFIDGSYSNSTFDHLNFREITRPAQTTGPMETTASGKLSGHVETDAPEATSPQEAKMPDGEPIVGKHTTAVISNITADPGVMKGNNKQIGYERKDSTQTSTTCPSSQLSQSERTDTVLTATMPIQNRIMNWYGKQLIESKIIKLAILVGFSAYFGGMVYSTSLMRQEFNPIDLVSADSYVKTFFDAFDTYSPIALPVEIVFRNVNQSDPVVQEEMLNYLDDITSLDRYFTLSDYEDEDCFGCNLFEKFFNRGTVRRLQETPNPMPFCWVRDFREYIDNNDVIRPLLANAGTFNEQVDVLFSIPELNSLYGSDIIREADTGEIVTSRCKMNLFNLDISEVHDSIDWLNDQRDVTLEQPTNQMYVDGETDELSFFTYSELYVLFEFYDVHIKEFLSTTLAGLVSVTFVVFLFLPHWSAIFYVLPLMIIMYIDLIGTIQFVGLRMNVITYVSLMISIGLYVDFIMHILLRYYESKGRTREEKVLDSLTTLGSSLLLGGMSTFLGVLILAASTSSVIRNIYICFFAMITLGCSHGLMLLPVLLLLFGPGPAAAEHKFSPFAFLLSYHG